MAATLRRGRGTLYLNGKAIAEGKVTLNPEDLQAPDVNTACNANTIGRGTIGGEERYFAGAIDEFEVYSAAMNAGPRVFSSAPDGVGHDKVTFRGQLAHAGGKAEVTFHWGTKDGGTDANAWEHALSAGPREPSTSLGPGPGDHLIEINCEGLKPGTTYFVRAFAKNALGEKWAGRTLRFKTADPSAEPKTLKK